MFSLFENFITCIGRKKRIKKSITLIVVGLDNAGKTTTIKSLKHQPNEEVAPTIGFASEKIINDKAEVTLYDLGGGTKIRAIWYNYLAESHGVIFVLDSTDTERMEECKTVLTDLIKHPKVKGKPILLLANKQDKASALDEGEICDALDLEKLVNENECHCRVELTTACSAKYKHKKWVRPSKSNRILEAGFSWLLQEIMLNYTSLQERITEDIAEQREREAEARRIKVEKVRKLREQRELEEERLQNKTNNDETNNISNSVINEREHSTNNFKTKNELNHCRNLVSDAASITNTKIGEPGVGNTECGSSNLAFNDNEDVTAKTLPGSVVDLQRDINNVDDMLSTSRTGTPNSSISSRNDTATANQGLEKRKKRRKKKKMGNQIQPFEENGHLGEILPSMLLPITKSNDLKLIPLTKNALPPIISSSASSPRPNMEEDNDILM